MQHGSLPFRYLGVPLAVKKLKYVECKSLIQHILKAINHWSTRHLSYGAIACLIKNVLDRMKAYWAQIFVFPKKLIREIEASCRSFLWAEESNSRRVHLAWESVCLSKFYGGWNLKHFEKWNNAAILKQIWHIDCKADRLWIKWVHTYYVKSRNVFQMSIPNAATWMLKKIIGLRRRVDLVNRPWESMLSGNKFSIQKAYRVLRQGHPKVP